jgi:hypothetical protein
MIYRSNIVAPDLRRHFKHLNPAIQLMGHNMPSDPDFDPNCGSFTHDEVAILYAIGQQVGGTFLDIGARMGWTAAHLAEAGCSVIALDPEYTRREFLQRAVRNTRHWNMIVPVAMTSAEWFASVTRPIDGCVIDGCHDEPEPARDGAGAAAAGARVIVYHDFQGKPVRDGVTMLMDVGWHCRVFDTPNGMCVLWRKGFDFVPPDHQPDPLIHWGRNREMQTDFAFERCE